MAFDLLLVDRVERIIARQPLPFFQKKMMGGLIFMVDNKMCVGIDKDKETGEDRLMARIGKEMYEEALIEKGVKAMDFTGRVMRGFIFIYPDGHDRDEDLEFWLAKALEYNKIAKPSKKKKKKPRKPKLD